MPRTDAAYRDRRYDSMGDDTCSLEGDMSDSTGTGNARVDRLLATLERAWQAFRASYAGLKAI